MGKDWEVNDAWGGGGGGEGGGGGGGGCETVRFLLCLPKYFLPNKSKQHRNFLY